jgi:hypothetical protein
MKWNSVSVDAAKVTPYINKKNLGLFFLKVEKFSYVTNDHL